MTAAVPTRRPLRRLSDTGALRIGVLISATGANLRTLAELARVEPASFQVCLAASESATTPALEVAAGYGIPTWPGDFTVRCGTATAARDAVSRAAYQDRARAWHDNLDRRLLAWEDANGPLDLVVLAYHRWIEGNLLQRYRGRMINQHPGDLAVLDTESRRFLTGRDPVGEALRAGHDSTRTSCFLVDATHDGGPILAQGPALSTAGRTPADAADHEWEQKRVSDRPCLEWTVRAFAAGRLALDDRTHPDGSAVVLVDGRPTPLGGRRLGDVDGH
ncbi:formyltransferase family protein [Actinoplanes sp. NPDC051859]|uniref:formyltransferase family protein n=1 Tax=Actinoplanes sp. NPDC051859 TaxID=3363909 RepID=UPI00379E2E26